MCWSQRGQTDSLEKMRSARGACPRTESRLPYTEASGQSQAESRVAAETLRGKSNIRADLGALTRRRETVKERRQPGREGRTGSLHQGSQPGVHDPLGNE